MESKFSAFANPDENFHEAPEFLKGPDLSFSANIKRPPLQPLDSTKDQIEFMQIDVDYYTALPPEYFD